MAENNPQKKEKIPVDCISDSKSSEKETSQHLHISQEKRLYHTVKGSAQATQVALAHTMAQCNPTVKRGLAKQPKIKKLPKGKASDKTTQTKLHKHKLWKHTRGKRWLLNNILFLQQDSTGCHH